MFTPWTMKSFQGPVKYVIGYWTCPGTISVYTKEKNVRATMEFEVLKRHILRLTLFIDMVQQVLWWERQKRCFGRIREEPTAYIILMKVFWGKEDQDKRRLKNGQTWIFLGQNYPFWTYTKKLSIFTFWCMVIIPLGHIGFTPNEEPKGFVKWFYKELDHEVGPWRRPSSIVWLHGLWCKPTLRNQAQGYGKSLH